MPSGAPGDFAAANTTVLPSGGRTTSEPVALLGIAAAVVGTAVVATGPVATRGLRVAGAAPGSITGTVVATALGATVAGGLTMTARCRPAAAAAAGAARPSRWRRTGGTPPRVSTAAAAR